MNYQEFIEEVRGELAGFYQEEARVELHTVTKNNQEPEMGICILPRGEYISPVLYLRPYYEEYRKGEGFVDILSDIIRQYNCAEKMNFPVDQLCDWEKVKFRVGARLVGASNNKEYLENIPHRRFLDLALVYYILFEGPEHRKSSATISRQQMQIWNITEEDLYRQASRNLPEMMRPLAMNLEEMLNQMLLEPSGMGMDAEDDPEHNLLSHQYRSSSPGESSQVLPGLYVVTNQYRYMGAVALFYPGLLDQVLGKLGWEECYIIPSSVHEVLLTSVDMYPGHREILAMVKNVNDTSVEATEILSYSVYHYDIRRSILEVLTENEPYREQVILGLRTGGFREV